MKVMVNLVWPISWYLLLQKLCSHGQIGAVIHTKILVIPNYSSLFTT